jgi:hypothetical protein
MINVQKLKKNKLIWGLIILVGVLVLFANIILYNGGTVVKKTDSTEVLQKLKDIQGKGGKFELTQKDIDEINNLYFGKAKNKGNITVKGVSIEVLEDELLINMPVTYKKVNLLVSSKGKLKVLNGEVAYVADNFKVGKLMVPKAFVMSQISKLNNEKFYVQDNLMKINPSALPFKINSLEVADNKIIGTAEKMDIKGLFKNIDKENVGDIDKQMATLDQKIQGAIVLMTEEEKEKAEEIQKTIRAVKGKSIEEKKKAISDTINKIDNAIDKTADSERKKELERIRIEIEKVKKDTEEKEKNAQNQKDTKRTALMRVQNELGNAYSVVETPKEQQIISTMMSTVSKMVSNPSYDSSSDQAFVKATYATLDAQGRNRVKNAIFSSVSGGSIGDLRQAFGM